MLTMFTVYERPTDYPNAYVVRRFEIRPGGPEAGRLLGVVDTLEQARALIPASADARLPRAADDPPQVVETWV